ncbi:kelch-like protein 21 [Ptychodera flava]|uniref:kelch-like protein 21 n=1 Tax=Ptychodera flava TaxID=63121 RepID=UPI00396A24AD
MEQEETASMDGDIGCDYVLHEPQLSNQILSNLNEFRKSGCLTDTVIQTGVREFPCHRAVLACSSPYFKAMFSSQMKETREGRITLDNVSVAILDQLLEYAYTSRIVINTSNAQELLEAANLLQYRSIVKACCQYLENQLHPSNCLGIQFLAELHVCPQLYKAAKSFSEANFHKVIQKEEFLQLNVDKALAYLSEDRLNVSKEDMIFDAAIHWVNHSFQKRVAELPVILKAVRVPYLSAEFLHEKLYDPVLKHLPVCVDFLRQGRTLQKCLQQGQELTAVYCMNVQPREFTKSEVMVVTGGFDADNTWVPDVRYFNPSNRKWTSLASFPADISGYKVVALNNDIYVTGGKSINGVTRAVFCYRSSCNQWEQVSSLEIPRQYHGACSMENSIYVVGGENNNGHCISDVECYHGSSDVWEWKQPLPVAVGNPAVVSHSKKLYVVGGYMLGQLTYKSMQCYDLGLDSWKVINTITIATRHFPALVLNDNIYILSGTGKGGMQVYNPKIDDCEATASMCTLERHLFGSSVIDGKIYVAGGMVNYKALGSVEMFDPDSNSWKVVGHMPRALRAHGCCVTIRKYLGPPFTR